MSDDELFGEFLSGDYVSAFGKIYARYALLIERFCKQRLSNAEDARDAAQETFLILLRRREKLQPIDLAHYLRRTARYVTNDIRRKHGTARKMRAYIAANMRAAEWPAEVWLDEVEARRQQIVQKALADMRQADQLLLRQRFVLGVCVTDIAKSLHISEHATRARISRAVQRLERRVNADPDSLSTARKERDGTQDPRK